VAKKNLTRRFKRPPPRRVPSPPLAPSTPMGDVALVIARDGQGTHILRRRSEDGPIEKGVLQPLVEGKPIDGEVVTLQARPEFPLLFDVKSEFVSPHEEQSRATADGPAQVASDAYRRGWDAVWGQRRDRSLN
jgi:hypothetical protein